MSARWHAERSEDAGAVVHRLRVEGRPMSHREVIAAWSDSAAFREFYLELLAAWSGPAFFWEYPPLHRDRLDRPSEFVLVDAPQLALRPADPEPFASMLVPVPTPEQPAVFENLSRDADLIVPRPQAGLEPAAFAHFAAFARAAPAACKHELLVALARELLARIDYRTLWLSTSGLGVAWLHLRLDHAPKYYQYAPYRDPAFETAFSAR